MSNKTDLIAKLKQLSKASDEIREYLNKYDSYQKEMEDYNKKAYETYQKPIREYKEKQSAQLLDATPTVSSIATKEIPLPNANKKIKLICPISGLVAFVAFVLWVFSIFSGMKDIIKPGTAVLIVFSLFIFVPIWFFTNGNIGNYYEWKEKRKKWLNEARSFDKSKKELVEEYLRFDEAFASCNSKLINMKNNAIKGCAEYRAKVTESYADAITKIDKAVGERMDFINNSGLLTMDSIVYVDDVIKNLEMGRADEFKEALNIAIDDERKDAHERERRAEARRQQEVLEQQASQVREHNLEMQRLERERINNEQQHAKEMEARARIQAEETRKLREELKKQNK